MTRLTAREWAEAGGVVVACAGIGAITAHLFFPGENDGEMNRNMMVGLAVGAIVGFAINWYTECPVCRAHAQTMGLGV